MSWTLASFVLLGVALVVAFAWYERSHPSSRVLALVATLAALAALGRIAFAPLPNVKPTTDIVLIAGYALGGAPGFAVGAISALASNFFFGQGPWTPWQMLAWGLVGLGGAGLARLAGRQLGRIPLAVACGGAGVLFGAIMNLSTWVTFYGGQPQAAKETLAVVYARGLPFDAAHVVGNVVFCLVFGPALLRAVRRFRLRFEVSWRPPPAAGALPAVAVALALAGGALAAAATPAQARSNVAYVLAAQNADGGWGGGPGQSSTQLHTGWAALGLAAAGRNPLDVHRAGRTPIDFIARNIGRETDTGELERTILVVRAAGLNPRRFAGHDLTRSLLRQRRADGSFGGQVLWTAFGICALRASGISARAPSVRRAVAWIARQQNPDGGFNFYRRGGTSGIDDTAGALEGLAAGGRGRSAVARRAAAWLARQQTPTGGFPLQPGGGANAQSTAWAVQGLVAAGRNPSRVRRGGRSPLAYLHSLTAANGSVRYSRTSAQTPVWVTAYALLARARRTFPLAPVRRRATRRRAVHRRTARTAAATPPAATAADGSPAAPAGAPPAGSPVSAPASTAPAADAPEDPPSPGAVRDGMLEIARLAGAATAYLVRAR